MGLVSRLRRVDQLLSSLGYCSRREAQPLCTAGRVTLDGATVERAAERVPASALQLDGEPLEFPEGLLVMVHKPLGVVCSHDERDGRLVYELLPPRWRLRNPVVTTVGRLDKDTSGVLLVTDDGKLVQRLTSPRHHVDKVYVATLDGDVTAQMVAAFAQGLVLDDGPTAPAVLASRGLRQAEVTVREGRYHQVRRMFAAAMSSPRVGVSMP
jgi:16S rRNA pseudouridine516 synthase